jgi:hypothetical protein
MSNRGSGQGTRGTGQGSKLLPRMDADERGSRTEWAADQRWWTLIEKAGTGKWWWAAWGSCENGWCLNLEIMVAPDRSGVKNYSS